MRKILHLEEIANLIGAGDEMQMASETGL